MNVAFTFFLLRVYFSAKNFTIIPSKSTQQNPFRDADSLPDIHTEPIFFSRPL